MANKGAIVYNVAYKAFEPMAKFAHLLGMFPFSNFGSFSKTNNGMNLIHRKSVNVTIFFTAFIMLLCLVQFVLYAVDEFLTQFDEFAHLMNFGWRFGNNLCGILALLFSLWKSGESVSIFNQLRLQAWSLGPYERKLRAVSNWMLFATVLGSTVLGVTLTVYSVVEFGDRWTQWSGIVLCFGYWIYGITLCQHLYVVFLATYLICTLRYTFVAINAELSHLLVPKGIKGRFPSGNTALDAQNLNRLRWRHQDCLRLLEEIESFLSPILLFVILAFCVDICCSVSSSSVLNAKYPLFKFLEVVLCTHVKLIPLCALCLAGEKLQKESVAGLRIMNQSLLQSLTHESEFQVQLMEFTLLANPAKFSASGFLTINNNLFVQIIGMIITYVVIMVQFAQDGH